MTAKVICRIGSLEIEADPDVTSDDVICRIGSLETYEFSGKKGIGCALLAVQKVKDGDPLGGGRVDVNKVFTSFDVDPITGEVSDAAPF